MSVSTTFCLSLNFCERILWLCRFSEGKSRVFTSRMLNTHGLFQKGENHNNIESTFCAIFSPSAEVEQFNIDVSTDAEARKEENEHRKHKFGSGILRYCCSKGKCKQSVSAEILIDFRIKFCSLPKVLQREGNDPGKRWEFNIRGMWVEFFDIYFKKMFFWPSQS